MEIFGRTITKEEVLKGGGIAAGAAALVTALALWGDKPITFGVSIDSHNSCTDPNPTLVRSRGEVLDKLGDAQLRVLAVAQTHSGTPEQIAAAKAELPEIIEHRDAGEIIFKDLNAEELTCVTDKNQVALSDKAQQMIGHMSAAGVKVSLGSR